MEIQVKTLGTVATYVNGRAFKPSEWEESGVPIIRIQNLTNSFAPFNYTSVAHEKKFLVKKGDLLFAWSASLGAHIWKGEDAWLNQHIFKVIPDESIDRDYLYYYLLTVVSDLYAKTHGSGMVHITKAPFMATKIPVPSLANQQRIVSRIEELLSQLDSGVETLNKVKRQLAVYRQAVLDKAFSGTLTLEWRKGRALPYASEVISKINAENNVVGHRAQMESIDLPLLPDSWLWVSIGDISKGAEYGTSQKSKKIGKVPVLRMGNIQNGAFDWSDLAFTDDERDIGKYLLTKGDVLFNRTNSPDLVGKTAAFKENRAAIFAGYLIRVNQVSEVDYRYLTYYLNSNIAKRYGNKVKTDGVNQSNINSQKLYSYPFPLCSLEEQLQIVIELESRMSVCDSIEQTVNTALQQAEAMRQSILKQAFEGGTNI